MVIILLSMGLYESSTKISFFFVPCVFRLFHVFNPMSPQKIFDFVLTS